MSPSEFLAHVKNGRRAEVEAALSSEPELAEAEDGGVSAVLAAIYHGHAEIGRLIAQRKRSVSFFEAAALGDARRMEEILRDDPDAHRGFGADGFHALGLAAYFGHREAVEALLLAGADPNQTSRNPLGVAALHAALSSKHKEIAADLIAAGADVNAPNGEGLTPLHYCAYNNLPETARLLLERGADPSIPNRDGVAPGELARQHGHLEVARLLGG